MRTCNTCYIDFPDEEFQKKSARCSECRKIYRRKYYENNPTYYKKKARAYAKKNAQIYANIKASTPCMDCNNTFPSECMDFDHVRGVKLGNVSKWGPNGSTRKLAEEIAKCELVCANCHRIRTKKRQIEKRLVLVIM